jgi:hypothetical protein
VYLPASHTAHVGLATSCVAIYLPAADVTWNVGVFHAVPVYATALPVIPLQLSGVDFVPVNLQVVFALNGLTELNDPLLLLYPLGYPNALHCLQLVWLAPSV